MSAPRLFKQSEQKSSKPESHYAIVANGNFLVREIILEAIANKIVVALDGAADKLARIDIMPSIILGDFDSITPNNIWGIKKTFDDIDENSEPYIGILGTTIVPAKDQNLTDLIKAIRYCDKQGATSIDILCATGGRLDHHEGAMRCLRSEYQKDRPILLHTEQQTLKFAKDEAVELIGEIKDKCGIVAFPSAHFSSTGLLYNGNDYLLEFGISESYCNSLTEKTAHVTIEGEALLMMPPQFISQRVFYQKNDVERLELQLRDAKQKGMKLSTQITPPGSQRP